MIFIVYFNELKIIIKIFKTKSFPVSYFVIIFLLVWLFQNVLIDELVVVVRIDCSDQLSRDEVTSLTYSSPLRVNVSVSAYFVQV